MKFKILSLAVIIFCSCSKNDNPTPVDDTKTQKNSILITPNQTDNNYLTTNESHYVVRNTKTHLNKLLLFLGGSFSAPKDYNYFCDYGATIGLDVISLSYPNNIAAFSMSNSNDPDRFKNFRDEICFGNQVSSIVDVNLLNCVTTRATKLLVYLKNTYPEENWEQYLAANNTILWSKVILAGHSQGAGHACYLGKFNLADKVIMLSGPNDYSTYFDSSANWLSQNGQTPIDKHYSLLHIQDEVVPFAYQVANLKSLGLLSPSESPTLADNLSTPYSNAHSLSLNIPATSFHNSTFDLNSKLARIWTYMFTN
jgi:hypothetical protein